MAQLPVCGAFTFARPCVLNRGVREAVIVYKHPPKTTGVKDVDEAQADGHLFTVSETADGTRLSSLSYL